MISRPYKAYAGLLDTVTGAITGSGKACKTNADCGCKPKTNCSQACNSITKKCVNVTNEANRGYFGPTASVERRADDAIREIQKTRAIAQKESADLKKIANQLLGESNQWQGTVGDILKQLEANWPIVAIAGVGIVLLFILKR